VVCLYYVLPIFFLLMLRWFFFALACRFFVLFCPRFVPSVASMTIWARRVNWKITRIHRAFWAITRSINKKGGWYFDIQRHLSLCTLNLFVMWSKLSINMSRLLFFYLTRLIGYFKWLLVCNIIKCDFVNSEGCVCAQFKNFNSNGHLTFVFFVVVLVIITVIHFVYKPF